VNQRFCILGLGPEIQTTGGLIEQLLDTAPLSPEVVFLSEALPADYVEAVISHRPQILLLSASALSPDLGGLPEYFGGINPKFRPQIFLLLDQLEPFFEAQVQEQIPFVFKNIGPVPIVSANQLALEEEQEEDYLAVTPAPDFKLSPAGKLRPIGNIPLSGFEEFEWKGRLFGPSEFFELVSYLLESDQEVPHSQSFYLFEHQLYLRTRFHLKEIESFQLQGLPICHLRRLAPTGGDNDHVFQLKLNDALMEHAVFFHCKELLNSSAWLKSQYGVQLETDHLVLQEYARFHLAEQNFEFGPHPNELLVDLTKRSNQLTWPSALWAVPFFEGLKDQAVEFDLPPEVALENAQILSLRERLFRRKEHLTERQKAYEGAKLMAAQEEDIKVMATRKLELLGQLIQRAELFDVESEEMILTLGKDCLVFYEDEMIARKITRHLQGSGKSLFFDIGGFTNLKGLLTYKTDHLVPFLTQGHILVTETTQRFLRKKLEKIAHESDHHEPAPPDLTAQELAQEKVELQSGFENLACLEAWNLGEPVFSELCQTLESELEDRGAQQIKNVYAGAQHEAVLLSSNSHLTGVLEARLPETNIHPLIGSPRLKKGQETDDGNLRLQLAQENGERIEGFITQTLERLAHVEADLIFIDQEPRLAQLMVERFITVPGFETKGYVILLHQSLPSEALARLTRLNCLPLYLGRHLSQLGQSWRLHLG